MEAASESRWIEVMDGLLDRPVQNEIRDAMAGGDAVPIGGDFSESSGLCVPSFFPKAGNAKFVPVLGYGPHNTRSLDFARTSGLPIVMCEDSFIRAATVFGDKMAPMAMRQSVSLTCDCRGLYFDAGRRTDIEDIVQNLRVDDSALSMAERIMDKVVLERISKYNNQPLNAVVLPGRSDNKVLVVDQDYGDTSILLGGASDDVFGEMLEAALDENPGYDVVVKTHPDSLVNGGRRGHFSDLADSDRVFVMKNPANPYSVMESVSKVYVATSTFGFEALMAGKPVHVFGMPWYAGWGATNDRRKIHRRSKTRSVVELFLAFYVKYTRYADPTTHCPCSVMDAINALLSLRGRYTDICGKL